MLEDTNSLDGARMSAYALTIMDVYVFPWGGLLYLVLTDSLCSTHFDILPIMTERNWIWSLQYSDVVQL